MSETAESTASERAHLRPYRRFVQLLFALFIAVPGFLFIRGIIRHLDRLPSIETFDRPQHVDDRALLACAEDLDRLENDIRKKAARAFAQAEEAAWNQTANELELARRTIIARCRLDEPHDDPVVSDLLSAAVDIERLLHFYGVLHSRFEEEALTKAASVRSALSRAQEALSSRK